MERMTKLQRVKWQVEKTYALQIATQKRTIPYIQARAVFSKLCREMGYTLEEIAEGCGVTHGSIINSLKKYPYLPKEVHNITKAVREYVLDDLENAAKLKAEMSQMDYLTENEKAYRRLTAAQRKVYDQRVSAILKMI